MTDVLAVASSLPTGLINRINNGAMRVFPEGTSTVADGAAAFVNGTVLTQSNSVQISQLTNAQVGQARSGRITQTNAAAQRVGFCWTIEALDCQDLRNSPLNATHNARLSVAGRTMFAVLEWDGPADASPADPINDWTSTQYTAGQFFKSSFTVLNVGILAMATGNWAEAPYIPYQANSGLNNLVYVIWTEDTVAQNGTFDFGLFQLIQGEQPLTFEHRPYEIDALIAEGDEEAVVVNKAALKAKAGGYTKAVLMIGRSNLFDGGGGSFGWDSSDVSALVALDPLEGVIVAPAGENGSQGAWRRINIQTLDHRWFGTPYSDAAVQGAIDYMEANTGASSIRTLVLVDGQYANAATWTVQANYITIRGESQGGVLLVRTTDFGPSIKVSTNTTTTVVGGGLFDFQVINNGTMTGPAIITDNVLFYQQANVVTAQCPEHTQMLATSNIVLENPQFALNSGTATDRAAIRIGASAISGLAVPYGSNIKILAPELQCGTGAGSTFNTDYGIRIECADGVWISDPHIVNTNIADLQLNRTSASYPLSNIFIDNALLDIGNRNAFRLDGTEIVNTVEFSGRCSAIGLTAAGAAGFLITGPCKDVSIDASVEGYDGSGIFINNALATDISIKPRVIRNNDADQSGDGAGIYIVVATRVSIAGGAIGGDGKQDWGVRFGSGATTCSLTGATIADNGGIGVQLDSGCTGITVVGNTILNNPGGALVDNSGAVPKLISNNLGLSPLGGSATWDPGSISSGAQADTTISVTGAVVGDFVSVSGSITPAGLSPVGFVSAADTVTFRYLNLSGSPVDLASHTVYATVTKRFG